MNIRALRLTFLAMTIVAGVAEARQVQPDQPTCAGTALAAAADRMAGAFADHQFVFIGSTHGDFKIEEFLMCLITRPAFTQRVTDIVVEWASAARQRLLDRYLLLLEDIPKEELSAIWLDTDEPHLWATMPQVRQFVEVLRTVNHGLPAARRIRLVGGNHGVEWARVRVVEDLAPYPFRTNLVPHLLVEHLAQEPANRTLIVYGDNHIRYRGANFMGDLEAALGRSRLFVVGRIGELVPEERPYLAAIGNPDAPLFAEAREFPAETRWPSSLRTSPDQTSGRLADYIDAFVYLGPERDRNLAGSLRFSAAEQRELERRGAIMSDPRRTMEVRYKGRDQWFRSHPNDFPARPGR
jgi:hypothetical protein